MALNAGWDEQLLGEEVQALLATDHLGFDIGTTGFSIPEIDQLVDGLSPEEPNDPDDDVVPEGAPRRCHLGDIWQLGKHRLVCGDALDPTVVENLMSGEVARMIFTEPPYYVKVDGHVGGSGKIKHREFAMASGEMSSNAFAAFLEAASLRRCICKLFCSAAKFTKPAIQVEQHKALQTDRSKRLDRTRKSQTKPPFADAANAHSAHYCNCREFLATIKSSYLL